MAQEVDSMGARTQSTSTVAVVRCESYEETAVQDAVHRGLELLGGVESFVEPHEHLLLKPNLLVGGKPNRVITTHPAVFRAVAQAMQPSVAKLSFGDSPGFGKPEMAAQRAGLLSVANELEIGFADFSHGDDVSFPEGVQNKQFTIARGVLAADGMISLSKLKTHGLTRITGAIKNQFGCIPGALKAEFHARLPMADVFSQMLVDLNRLLAPRLFVMDGILAMEGNGPRNGTPKAMNLLLFSRDPVALDATVCRLVNLDPELVLPITYGVEFGLGAKDGIDYVGDPIDSFVQRDFKVNRSKLSTTEEPGRASRLLRRFVVPKPVIRAAKCTACGTCVSVCPVSPKAVEFRGAGRVNPPIHDYQRCIRCYCCQELCPEGAIDIVTPPLGRLIHRR